MYFLTTRYFLPHAVLTAVLLFLSCFANAETLYVLNSQSRTISSIDTNTDAVNNSFAALGNVPNKIVVDADYIWAVNSGDNAVQKISRSSGATLANIFIGAGSNPWDAVKHDDNLYVSALFTNKVYRISTLTGAVTGNVTVGTAPEALLVVGNKLYVTNAGNYMQNYAGSSVSVVNLDSFTVSSTIPVSKNPQYFAQYGGMLHVSCTGNWADVGGAICIIDPASDTVVHTVALGSTPGSIYIANDNTALVADSNGMNLFAYNPATYEVLHGALNPIIDGGSEITGTASFIAVLKPNWGGNGIVKLLHADLSSWKQYTVAMMPTDMKLGSSPTGNEDYVMQPNPLLVYPNPVRNGGKLNFSSPKPYKGELGIYNVKGQKVAAYPFAGKDISVANVNLPTGIYFFRMQDKLLGRFAVIK